MSENTDSALMRLERKLAMYQSLLVAFSGGVDSGVLLTAARRVLGDSVLALTSRSPSLPAHELNQTVEFASALGARHLIVESHELQNEGYTRNDRNRCYVCKTTLFKICEEVAQREGISAIAYGYTVDDAADYRPGHRAARERNVQAPLFDAGLRKADVRSIARELGLPLADKPGTPCLASRVPYGSVVTVEKLNRVEKMENLLRELGFRVFRARYDGKTMRLELEQDQIGRAAEVAVRRRILERANELGIGLVTLDLEGFRSGKLNEL